LKYCDREGGEKLSRIVDAKDLTLKLLERMELPKDPKEAGEAVVAAYTAILKGMPDSSGPLPARPDYRGT
jgi:hypothetical protein